MFAGIIKEIGLVEEITPKGAVKRLSVKAGALSKEAGIGDSISVDGVCLTLVEKSGEVLYFDLMPETLEKTTLGLIKNKEKVNLEPPLALRQGVSGHLVSGHIDEVGKIRSLKRCGDTIKLCIGISEDKRSLLVPKGSVAVNGASLTVNGIGRDFFTVDIIPHTVKATTIGLKKAGDSVNIEFDMMGKYVLENLSRLKVKSIDEDFLKEHGFM